MEFVLVRLRAPDGGLFHRYCDGEAAIPAFAADYAFILRALIELYETTFDPRWLHEAVDLDRFFTHHFSHPDHAGYFSTSVRHDTPIIRKREFFDDVIPSPNSVMLEYLVRMGNLTGDPAFHDRAFLLAAVSAGPAAESPVSSTAFLCGLDQLLGPATGIVITGEQLDDARMHAMLAEVWQVYLPKGSVLCRTRRTVSEGLDTLAPFTSAMVIREGEIRAYVCQGTTCQPPVTRPLDLRALLSLKKEEQSEVFE
jgi:hypothetical protein